MYSIPFEKKLKILLSLAYVLQEFNLKKRERNVGKPPSIPRLNVYKSEPVVALNCSETALTGRYLGANCTVRTD
jgi:hypothetical protein